MGKLERWLAKAKEEVKMPEIDVPVGSEVWKVRQLTLTEMRSCTRIAEKGEEFDGFRYSDARLVKATEHDFDWNNEQLKTAYGVGTKYELPAKMFDKQPEVYRELQAAVRKMNDDVSEQKVIDDLKNSSEPTEKQVTSVEHSLSEEENQAIS